MTLEEMEVVERELIEKYNASENDAESESLLERIAFLQSLMLGMRLRRKGGDA